jgi:alpha-L-glutamate ligase-like protein
MPFNTAAILGMNARNQLYVSQNSNQARQFAHSKLATKVLLQNADIFTPTIYNIIALQEDIEAIDWSILTSDFVIKPTNGSGGKGIVVLKKQIGPETWLDSIGHAWSCDQLKLHCSDIIEGKYSTHTSSQNNVIIEERVPIHPLFLKYSYGGTPDVRVIIYNSVPIMSMLRLPTKASEGRANLHQGAIGVGIDLATGITTTAITGSGSPITCLPGTKRKLNGILIPFWKQVLLTAVQAAQIADLTYGGIDLFVHKDKGPLVVEMNTQPGLAIQLANRKGLKQRLERVSGLNVLSPEHGVKIARTLFASPLIDRIIDKEKKTIIKPQTTALVYDQNKKTTEVAVQIATGRFRSIISQNLADELGLYHPEDMLWFVEEGGGEKTPVIAVSLNLAGRKINTTMAVSRQLNQGKIKIKLGRKDLDQFLVEV